MCLKGAPSRMDLPDCVTCGQRATPAMQFRALLPSRWTPSLLPHRPARAVNFNAWARCKRTRLSPHDLTSRMMGRQRVWSTSCHVCGASGGGVQKRLSGLASIDHTENGTTGEGPCKREENMSLCEHYASSSYRQSRVAQWPACWAHNPKVRGSKPRSAIDYTTRTRRVGGSHANAHADVRTGVHVHADTTRHARTNARALD